MTTFNRPLIVSSGGTAPVSQAAFCVPSTAEFGSILVQSTKNVRITVTALNSTQSTVFSTNTQPFVLLCLTVGGTTVGIPAYRAGTLGG